MNDALARHRRRQGAIIALLLLGPAPISFFLFLAGTGPAALAVVLAATAALVGAMLALYAKQRREAPAAGLPVLPGGQVAALLVMLGGVSGGTFLLPDPATAGWGAACLLAAAAVIYGMGVSLRKKIEEPDERSAVLVLGLMAVLIALAAGLI